MNIETNILFNPANLGAFGDLEVCPLTPLLHLSFATGLRDQLTGSTTANGGTVDVSNGRLRLQSSTANNGSAIAYSVKPASYRPGQALTARLTPSWASAAASSTQIWGIGNALDGYFFGYSGATFGIFHRINGSDTFTPQSSWNGYPMGGTPRNPFNWDETKAVPLQIKYPYLGHGNITFWALDAETSSWILCHTIKYSGSSAVPQLTNPCLQIYGQVINSGNATNLISYLTCASVLMDGPREYLGPQFGIDSIKNTVTTEANLLCIRSATTVNGVANRGLVRLRALSMVNDNANGIATFRIKRGATLGGSPSYSAIDGTTADAGVTLTSANSVMSYDTAGTFSGGKIIYNAYVGRNSQSLIDLTPFNIFVAPSETLVISGACTASASLGIAVNWQEDVQ